MSTLEDIRYARIYLTHVTLHQAVHVHRLVADLGAVAVAELVRTGDVPADVAAELRPDYRTIRVRDTDFADPRHGIRLVIPEDTDLWPAAQLDTGVVPGDNRSWVAPLALWTSGSATLPELWARSVTVTGSRAATGYGCYLAGDLGQLLAERQITVTTGASYGIEGSAARGTLAAGGPTVVVLPCGIDTVYPSGHRALLERIAADGTLVSAYPPGTRPRTRHFYDRAGLLAAAGQVLVVVEAGARSGSLTAAEHANRTGRTVMAVPGPITSATSAGNNRLLRDRAAITITELSEVADTLDQTQRPIVGRVDAPPR